MAKSDFKHFSKYIGIRRQQKETGDACEESADLIYRYAGDIKAHALASRIYGSTGEEDYSEEEVAIIRRVAEGFCLPGFIDGLYEQLGISDKKGEQAMVLTDAEKTELRSDILNVIKAESQGVDELAEVTSLDNIKSLPALRGTELVAVPISLLSKPATDAAVTVNVAVSSANTVAGKATEAMNTANSAAATANEKAGVAQVTAETANTVAVNAGATAVAVEDGLSGSMMAEVDGESDMVKLILLGKNDKEITLVDILGGTGSGGNTCNVTEEVPLESGYYTLVTAIVAVNEKYWQKGCCITYEAGQDKWETKQFAGTSLMAWEGVGAQEDLGEAGTVKSLTVNGEKKVPDAEGNVGLTIEQPEVDGSLDADNTDPVENQAVTTKLDELDANTVFGVSAELSDDETSVRLTLTNKSGAEIASVDLLAGSGGGGEGGNTTRIVLGASTDTPAVKEGGSARFTWMYNRQYFSGDEKGESTGQKVTV